ncbi:hypothetical protein [Planococcus sp. ISL-110]|uniref:hypothetical protein n=1 Tax=Planococcus sp. ISL-110 TaxID=2819167 RepID=UPI001BE67412|nr:hypothetical protein [Planococcus sp. ISL-110]MBT2572076.1 hypothetical protein [Planococcus sp. ISL-110]
MTLTEYDKRYETLLHSNLSSHEKDVRLSSLMTELESAFEIPMLRTPEWEEKNRKVIALYRKISLSRNF